MRMADLKPPGELAGRSPIRLHLVFGAPVGAWLPPLYPLLVAAFPVLTLLSQNVQEAPLGYAMRSLTLALVGCSLVFLLLRIRLKDRGKVAALTALLLVLFFSYGHLYNTLKTAAIGGVLIGRHRYLVPIYLLVLLAGISLVVRSRGVNRETTRVLTLVSAALLVMPLVTIARYTYQLQVVWAKSSLAPLSVQASGPLTSGDPRPDIYYIILDGYGRFDVMSREFGFDPSEFQAFLEDRGFYVADGSRANHNWTSLSLGSSLNMDYAQNLGLRLVKGDYPGVFIEPIRHSRVRRKLEALGYSIIGMRSGYPPTELLDADQFLSPDPGAVDLLSGEIRLNAFESQLVYSTALKVLLDFAPGGAVPHVGFRTDYPYSLLREIILAEFRYLKEAPGIPGPKFVFAHIVAPHPPYLFGPSGEALEQEGPFTLGDLTDSPVAADSARYRDQATYVTARIEEVIDAILEGSSAPPIIIVQSDHGPPVGIGLSPDGVRLPERFANLNLYFFPYGCRDQLYPTITPVNSFRVLFNCYFGEDLPLLEDHSYYSLWPRLVDYEFTLMDDELDP